MGDSQMPKKAKNLKFSSSATYAQSNNLKKHYLKTHEKIYHIPRCHKDFHCESCGKSMSAALSLRNHIHTVHEGHKDFKCESCGKLFSQEGNLNTHIYTVHGGHKDYK